MTTSSLPLKTFTSFDRADSTFLFCAGCQVHWGGSQNSWIGPCWVESSPCLWPLLILDLLSWFLPNQMSLSLQERLIRWALFMSHSLSQMYTSTVLPCVVVREEIAAFCDQVIFIVTLSKIYFLFHWPCPHSSTRSTKVIFLKHKSDHASFLKELSNSHWLQKESVRFLLTWSVSSFSLSSLFHLWFRSLNMSCLLFFDMLLLVKYKNYLYYQRN